LSEKKFEAGHCPKCGSERADVVAEHKEEYHECDFDAETYFRVLECRGCGQHYFKSVSSNSEDCRYYFDEERRKDVQEYIETIHYWPPAAKRRPPEWVSDIGFEDRVLASLFGDVYMSHPGR
jgi:transcription elongation factor Elf1